MEKNTKIAGLVLLCTITIGAISFALYYGKCLDQIIACILQEELKEIQMDLLSRINILSFGWLQCIGYTIVFGNGEMYV